jgi:methionine-gamma-lyase
MSDEDLSVAGIGEGLIRMSVGFTGSLEQRWQQLAGALSDLNVAAA